MQMALKLETDPSEILNELIEACRKARRGGGAKARRAREGATAIKSILCCASFGCNALALRQRGNAMCLEHDSMQRTPRPPHAVYAVRAAWGAAFRADAWA